MKYINESLKKIFIVILVVCGINAQLYADESCTLRNGSSGICRLQNDCPSSIREQRLHGIRPIICSFQGKIAIVCCSPNDVQENPYNSNSGGFNNQGGQRRPQPNQNNEYDFNPTPSSNSRPSNYPNRQTPRPRPTTETAFREEYPNRQSSNYPVRQQKRISERKCDEYSTQVTQEFHALPLLPDPEPLTFSVPKCIYNSSPLIVGGKEALIGEFPHMAAVGTDDPEKGYSFFCGGSLISEDFVVTAGHCTGSNRGELTVVRVGEHNLVRSDDSAKPQDIKIAQIIIHPEYKPPIKYNDIALLRLEKRATLNNLVRPACLWQRDTFEQNVAVATGWGQLGYTSDSSDTLQKVSLPIVSPSNCRNLVKADRKLNRGVVNEQMCAGDERGGKDACRGDSGGPLQIANTDNRCIYYIIGVTSFGIGCAEPNSPGIYTRISSYVPWIEETVWPNQ